MVHAYVMVKTAAGASERTIDSVRDLPEVTTAHVVAGDYDMIAEVSVEDVYSVLHTASSKIQSLNGVLDTRTYIALD